MLVQDLVTNELVLRVDETEPTTVRVTWLGKANERRSSAMLAPYFEQLCAVAETAGRFLEFHFEKLDYINSSAILAIMQFIQNLRRKKIRLVLYFDETQKWQRLTFDVLRHMDRKDGLVELHGTS